MRKTSQIFNKLSHSMQDKITGIIISIITIIVSAVIIYIDHTVPTYHGDNKYDARLYIYTNCHEMCNNFIVAQDGRIQGFVRADDKNIDKILSVVMKYDFEEQDIIVKYLDEFRQGDYHSAVIFHNLCWKALEGDIGYAVDLRDNYK